ncbi:MAG: HDOD domain-containing protein [Desulfobacterales bacterium]|nr:MAG: HDOD domain-containing protein [Desulfobacterales bacterium]
MTSQKTFSLVESYVNKIPAFPVTVSKVINICDDENASPADLNKVISLDPVLTGKILKLINSAYFGLSPKIVSLARAIIMLGMNTVKNLVLSTAIMSSLGNRTNFKALNMNAFWRHSIGVGILSKLIAKERQISQSKLEEYFIAGLLHDIGKIPLNSKLTDKYEMAIDTSEREYRPLYLSEISALEMDHTQSGRLIAEKWKLGPEITDTVTYHRATENYRGEQKDILYTVNLANYFANISDIGFSGDPYPEDVVPNVFESLFERSNIALDFLENITDEVNLEIEKAQIFLQIAE